MDEHGLSRTGKDIMQSSEAVPGSVPVRVRPCPSTGSISPTKPLSPETLAANAALSLLNLACHLLDRQLAAQAENFLQEGGFTERLYRLRSKRRP